MSRSARTTTIASTLVAFLLALAGLALLAPWAQTAVAPDAPRLMTARAGHTATPLANGVLLIAGGATRTGSIESTEYLDAKSGVASEGPRLLQARSFHSATMLADGRVLLAGGRRNGKPLSATEIYDPARAAFLAGPSLNQPRAGHSATLLADGRVLLAGGDAAGTAEIFEPASNAFRPVAKLALPRASHAAIRLASGNVLLTGGNGAAAATAEIFDAHTLQFASVRGGMKAARVAPGLKLLPDGKVQVHGGDAETTMELFNPAGYFSSRGHLLRDSNSVLPVLRSPARGALIGFADGNAAKLQRAALGSMADNLFRASHTLTTVAGSNTVVIAGGVSREGKALDSVVTLSECGATVTTDLTDYYPGQTVTMSGAGWLPGEAISLNLHRDTNDPPDTLLSATADSEGNWTNAEYVVQEYDANVAFVLTATGESGCVAQTTFTDSVISVTITAPAAPVTVTSFPTVIPVTFSYQTAGGGSSSADVEVLGTTNQTLNAPIPSSTTLTSTTINVTVAAGTPNGTYNLRVTVRNNGTGGPPQRVDVDNGMVVVNVPTATPTTTTVTFEPGPYVYRGTAFTATAITTGAGGFSQDVTASIVYSGDCSNVTTTDGCTATASFAGNASHQASGGSASITITQATPTVSASAGAGNPYTYDTNAHEGSCTVTGVGGADLGPLDATHTPVDPPVDAGSYTVSCDYPGSTNYAAASDSGTLTINQATPTVTASAGAGNPYTYDTNAHEGSCTVTGVGGADLGPLDATHTPVDPPVDAGSYTVHCDYLGSTNYAAASDTETLTINQATPTVTASAGAGNPYTYDTNSHEGSCTVTGVGGADLGPLDATHTPTDPPVDAGSYTVHCDYPGSTNYAAASDTESLTINQATPTVTASAGAGNPYTYDTFAHEGSCTVTGVGGVDLGPLDATHTPTDPPVNAGTYTVHCDYPGSTNYAAASDTETLTIEARDALVNYIGQTTFVTSGGSATTAQVNLSASVQDPTGTALTGAKMDFIDITNGLPGKVLASGVTVSPVPNSPANTGTANKIVTLSTGQYGAESYLILVRMTGNYDNTDQSADDKTATVVVAKPAVTNETTGGGTIAALPSAAGLFPGNGSDVSFSVGMKYNKSGSNLQGKITVSVPQADGILYVKSTAISSMAIKNGTPKTSTIYTKAAVYKVLNDGSIVTVDGNVTLRIDVADGAPDKLGVTVLSSKDSVLYYSNQWVLVGTTWKTELETLKTGLLSIL